MKSVIMAIFLLSVSLGNLFTSAINGFIQVKDPLAKVESSSNEVLIGGYDAQTGTEDDIKLTFNSEGKRTSLDFAGRQEFDKLLDSIVSAIEVAGFTALSTDAGTAMVEKINDPWGNPYRYRLINRNSVRVWSDGPDQTDLSQWDQGAVLNISRPDDSEPSGFAKFFDKIHPEQPWLERRKAELGIETKEQIAEAGPKISRSYFVGGRVKLEGAAYFWFFTAVMLGAALLFVVVAKLYKPKEYYHDDEDHAKAREEAIGN